MTITQLVYDRIRQAQLRAEFFPLYMAMWSFIHEPDRLHELSEADSLDTWNHFWPYF